MELSASTYTKHTNAIMVLRIEGKLFLKSIVILLFLDSTLSNLLSGKEGSFPHDVGLFFFFCHYFSICPLKQRDHPERGNLHGKGDCWPA